MPFDPASPPAQDLTSLAWATWTFYDRTGATSLTEAQVHARLGLHVRVVSGVSYQRPLAAAADFITRPEAVTERDRNGLTDKYVDPLKIAAAWRDVQAGLDAAIPKPADGSGSATGGDFDGRLDFKGWG